jgi:hypothetical protein
VYDIDTMERLTTLNALLLSVCLAVPALPQEAETTARPAVPVSASSDRADTVVHFSGIDQPGTQDIALGALANDQKPNQHIIPTLTVSAITGSNKDWDVAVTVHDLIPFGESTVPVLLKRQPNQTLRFQKAGLVAKPAAETGFAVREGNQLLIVLENTSAFDYPMVRARLRFQDVEVCQATADQSVDGKAGNPGDNKHCDNPTQWASFSVSKYAPVTLRVPPAPEWFLDPKTSFPKSDKRKGVLSLQFVGAGPAVYEQALPIEVQFDPSEKSIFRNLVRVGLWLIVGALLALALRVTIPNYRRKSVLKDQLSDAAKATHAISDDVESMLRVLLRVERLNLDQLRRSAWISGPSFQDFAQLIEQGLATLKRKIDFTRRLDTSRGRMSILLDQDPLPTRIAAIDRELDSACETLMRDQLVDQDWVYIQQRLEAADKLLHDPTQEEKDAFQALLVQRWKSIRDFFDTDGGKLKVPPSLAGMESAFPSEECLPKASDPDGSQWVAAAGLTRVDLQLGALETLRDYLFLAPAVASDLRWANARDRLKVWCGTPSIENLAAARLLIDELAEGVDVDQILTALQACQASIEMSPQVVQTNEKARFALRFKDPALNTAAARRSILCEWAFQSQPNNSPQPEKTEARVNTNPQTEHGWEIYHYFAANVTRCEVIVRFYVNGELVNKTPVGDQQPAALEYKQTIHPQARGRDFRVAERFERVFPEALQLGAALLVPLATLAVTQAGQGTSGSWWELLGVGFGSETIRAILTGKPEQSGAQPKQG